MLQETQQIPTEEVQLEIYLSNGQKVKVNILTSDQTEDVLEVRLVFPKHTSASYFQSLLSLPGLCLYVSFNSNVYGFLTPLL